MARQGGRLIVWAAILCAGCAFRAVGFVESANDHPILMEGTGERHRLRLEGDAEAIAHLDGHMVEVAGRKGIGAVRVRAWRVLEGPHGMTVWTGLVQRSGQDVGIANPASGQIVWVDDEVAPELAEYAGDPVAAEGYLEQDRLVVVHWRPLVDEPSSGPYRP